MFRFQNLFRHDWHYAGLGLLCALLVAGVPACLMLFGSRTQSVAQAAAQPVMQSVAQPSPVRAGLNTAGLRPLNNNNELSKQLPAAELFDAGLYAAGELDPSICRPTSTLHESHESHGNRLEVWPSPSLHKRAAPTAN